MIIQTFFLVNIPIPDDTILSYPIPSHLIHPILLLTPSRRTAISSSCKLVGGVSWGSRSTHTESKAVPPPLPLELSNLSLASSVIIRYRAVHAVYHGRRLY
ncbi:hypothetical protein TWF569_011007 [Orbilia oligospora]|nr:hypothetical protein TWF569_011007 [Orbilia oligospora]